MIEKRQGLKIACLEGIAFRKGWITADKMRELAQPMLKNQYGQYLLKVVDELAHTGKAISIKIRYIDFKLENGGNQN